MKIIESKDGTLVKFNSLSFKLKVLFLGEALVGIVFCMIPVPYYDDIIKTPRDHIGLIIFSTIITITGLLIFYNYLKRVLQKEALFITTKSLTIINYFFFSKRSTVFDIDKIWYLSYKGRSEKTDHPLKGNSYDYLGFETKELEISEVHSEGNISLKCENKIVYFGRDVYSWDAEKLNELLIKVTSNKLIIDNLPLEISEVDNNTQANF